MKTVAAHSEDEQDQQDEQTAGHAAALLIQKSVRGRQTRYHVL